jgi:adhesin transport system outer membrane protein
MGRVMGISRYLLLLVVLGQGWGSAFSADDPDGLGVALRATLSLNPAVSGKRAELAAKGFGSDIARAQRYPILSAQAAANDDNTRPINLIAKQPLWAFGRIDNTIAYADADVLVEQADLLRVRRELLDRTAVAYAMVLGARAKKQVAEGNIVALDTLYRQIVRREKGHLASSADVSLAQARLLQAQAERGRYIAALDDAQSELANLTQVKVKAELPIPETLTVLPTEDELVARALTDGADVQLKSQQLALANSDVVRERSAAMPTLYLQVDRYYNAPAYMDDTRVGLVLESSLDGMGFAAAGRSKAAGAIAEAARNGLISARNDMRRIVMSLYTNQRIQQSLADTLMQSVTGLISTLASYHRQYDAGRKSWLEVLNMQRELNEQRLQQVQAMNDGVIYALKLQALTGGLDSLAGGGRDKP